MNDRATNTPWRQNHLGHWLTQALQRFDARVLALMAANDRMPLALANLCARARLTAAHIQITRHLKVPGMRLSELAAQAGVSKQAMGKLVDQCEAWALVQRQPDPLDGRACQVVFTEIGLAWLQAYHEAVDQAETEWREAVGPAVVTVMALGLEAYAA